MESPPGLAGLQPILKTGVSATFCPRSSRFLSENKSNEFSTDIDALGDAYEYLIGQFAAGSGKKAGEFYTPQQISDILSTIVTLNSQDAWCAGGD